jgi:hypothetical protein
MSYAIARWFHALSVKFFGKQVELLDVPDETVKNVDVPHELPTAMKNDIESAPPAAKLMSALDNEYRL